MILFSYTRRYYMGFLFDKKKEDKKDTARDDYSQKELNRRVEEIKRKQERETEETKRRVREADAMISDSIKKMNAIANGPDAQSIRSSDLDYLNRMLGRNQSSSTEQALIVAETKKLHGKEQPKYVPDFSDDRLFLMAHGVSIVDNSPEFINQFYGILKEFGHYGYGTNRYPSLETSLAIANNLKSFRDSGADIDGVLLSQAEKNKREKDARKSQNADYTRELGQMLDDRSTGKAESKDTKNFKY